MILHIALRALVPYVLVGFVVLLPAWAVGIRTGAAIPFHRLLLYLIPFATWLVAFSLRSTFAISAVGGQSTSTLSNLTVEPYVVAAATLVATVPQLCFPAPSPIERKRHFLVVLLTAIFGALVGLMFPALPE